MQIRENISLRPYNTFGMDVRARYFATFDSEEALEEGMKRDDRPGLILGGGSNVLLTGDVDGLVLRNEIVGMDVVKEEEEYVYVKVGAGENWHQFVLYCLARQFAGVENLALIPGSVGASPMQNIGAYGVEIKDVFHELEAFHLGEGRRQMFTLNDCAFGYRDSVFKHRYRNQFVITSVTYRLRRTPVFHTSYGAIGQELERMGVTVLSIQNIAQAVINIRSSKLPDPKEVGNAGSFFKNPQIAVEQFNELKKQFATMPSFPLDGQVIKVPAGWLIEQCGWKGYRKGDAGCYPKQALVLVNYGKATGREIYELSEEILQSVQHKFGITLEREVNIV
jgi:UDP-N-acetylmuramate dehydrogenase